MFRFSLITLFLLTTTTFTFSQAKVDTSYSAEDLILNEFLRGGVAIENIAYKGSKRALGLFEAPSDLFPLSKGILLSTGFATSILGPNNAMGMSAENFTAGDSTLELICRGSTYDACIIEFDFIPSSENVAFDFVFGSEEYPEYVNSAFNDVFAFIITNPENDEKLNIAFIPKTHDPITVNTVNHLKNTQYYIDNPSPIATYYMLKGRLEGPDDKKKKRGEADDIYSSFPCKKPLCEMIQYDGFTKVLTAKTKLTPDKRYHFKIAIADVHDKIYDSGVILQAHTFKSYDRLGYIKGDTSGYRVKDEDLEKELKKEEEKVVEEKKIPVKKEPDLYTVLFDFDSSVLSDSAEKVLKEVALQLKADPSLSVMLSGHTDNKGSDAYNIKLSQRRNASVKRQLEKWGIQSDRIRIEHYGESKPKEDNASDIGRSRNRRVEIRILNSQF